MKSATGIMALSKALVLLAASVMFTGYVEAQNMACSCTASACGNNAIGGDQGDIFTDIPPSEVSAKFQTNSNTGWTCVVPAKVRGSGGPQGCFCAGYCGNGGIGADPNYFDIGLSQDTINSSYGGGAPGNRTGWLCGNYRGMWSSGPDSGSAISAAELQQKGYPYPTDLVTNANHTQFANYAWRLFIASTQQTTATLANGAGRGAADVNYNFIDSGNASAKSNPLVFESLYHRTEAFPYYNLTASTTQPTTVPKPPSPIGQVPTYYTYYVEEEGGNEVRVPLKVSGQPYVFLDETNQIGQNFLYYQNSNDKNFPVLFMAKVNATETQYAWDKNKPSPDSAWVFPSDVLEVKTAWRRVSDINTQYSDPSDYHQAQATYYVADAEGSPNPETDTFALIAIHIIQKTDNYQQFIFSTFEHVNAVSRDSSGKIIDPAFKLTYPTLAYDNGNTQSYTAIANGAYDTNAPGQPSTNNNVMTTYALPDAGSVSQDYTTVVQPQTIIKEVNDVNNQVYSLITGLDENSIWANYRLKGVQAVPTSDQTTLDYYLANIVVESSKPGIQLFRGGANGGLPVDGVFTNNRNAGADSANISLNVPPGGQVPPATYTMGGCQGCHGRAQQLGRDFSFLAQAAAGNGKELDSVPDTDLTAEQQAAHNQKMAASSAWME